MLFNSSVFIFIFLPLTLLAFLTAARYSAHTALIVLALASLVFYGWWDIRWVPLLLISIAFNFTMGKWIAIARTNPSARSATLLLITSVTVNILVLIHYKYTSFVLENIGQLLHIEAEAGSQTLPLGISFFTFTQIAFLVDVYQCRAVDFDPIRYGLFVTYYPHLIAGPILHHGEMMPQFSRPDILRADPSRLADGLTFFVLGLFKKTVLADQLGKYVSSGFDAAGHHPLGFYEAWGAALSYTLQIYFDFSGYSDMAIGLAMMIGVALPINFHSPYKSTNIVDFWRRWHITLSRFLRDYLYIPLGGNRKGIWRRYINLMSTMVLGGLWHGAGWTFVAWGALHGFFLVTNNLWRQWSRTFPRLIIILAGNRLRVFSWAITFLAVVVTWVFFRARDMAAARALLIGMAGWNGAPLPDQLISMAPLLRHVATPTGTVPYLADGTVMGAAEMFFMLIVGLGVALFCPAMPDMRSRTRYALLVPCAALAFQQVVFGSSSEFLYFQF